MRERCHHPHRYTTGRKLSRLRRVPVASLSTDGLMDNHFRFTKLLWTEP